MNYSNGNWDDFVGNSLKCNDCAGTIATYLFPNSDVQTCKIYIRKNKFYILIKIDLFLAIYLNNFF